MSWDQILQDADLYLTAVIMCWGMLLAGALMVLGFRLIRGWVAQVWRGIQATLR